MSDTMDTNLRSSWTTLKTMGAIVGFAIMVGSVVVAVTLTVTSGPTREEFDRERDQSRGVVDGIKDKITNVEKEQIKIRGEVEMINGSQRRVEDKLDKVIESAGGARR